jgi:hypothetical protein
MLPPHYNHIAIAVVIVIGKSEISVNTDIENTVKIL